MRKNLRVALASLAATRPVLTRVYGKAWPMALLRGFLTARTVVRHSPWAGRTDAEARHVRTLALLPALCLDLQRRLGDQAPGRQRELIAAAVQAANAIETEASGLENIHDPRERWHAYFERCLIQGVGAFNENECLIIEAERFHYRVWRCVYHELMRTAGVPQLATVVCDLDVPYHNRLFPSFAFHRGDSERNTLAYGNRWCDYVWDQRTSSDRGRAGGRA